MIVMPRPRVVGVYQRVCSVLEALSAAERTVRGLRRAKGLGDIAEAQNEGDGEGGRGRGIVLEREGGRQGGTLFRQRESARESERKRGEREKERERERSSESERKSKNGGGRKRGRENEKEYLRSHIHTNTRTCHRLAQNDVHMKEQK